MLVIEDLAWFQPEKKKKERQKERKKEREIKRSPEEKTIGQKKVDESKSSNWEDCCFWFFLSLLFLFFLLYALRTEVFCSQKKLPIPIQHVSRLIHLSGEWRGFEDDLDYVMGGNLYVDKEGL